MTLNDCAGSLTLRVLKKTPVCAGLPAGLVLLALCIPGTGFGQIAPVAADRPSLPLEKKSIQYGDVLMRSLRVWPKDQKDTKDTLATAKAFKVDAIVWIYDNTREFNDRVHAEGIRIGTSMADNAAELWYGKLGREKEEAFAAKYTVRNLDGEQVLMEHFKLFKDPYLSHFVADITVPGWVEFYSEYLVYLYNQGVDTIHRDDPGSIWTALTFGGTFTDSAVEYFRGYLEKKFDTAKLAELGVADVKTFNVREHFKALGAPKGRTLWQWRGSPLMRVYKDAMLEATVEYYEQVRSYAEKKTGRSIPWSQNTPVGPYTPLDRSFDFRISEYDIHLNQPLSLLTMSRYAAREGKMQALISMVDGAWTNHPAKFVSETRSHIATAYAAGMLPLVPWCMYMKAAPRYYGTTDDFGDLFHFVSGHRNLFDGHELVAAAGLDTQTKLYSWLPNKEMRYPEDAGRGRLRINRENVFAFLREQKTSGSKVIHVVDWNAQPGSFELSFSPKDILGSDAADLTILRPGEEDVAISGYTGGTLEVPAVSPWGLITLKPAAIAPGRIAAPQLISPARAVIPRGTPVVLESGKGCTVYARVAGTAEFAEIQPGNPPVITQDGLLEAYAVHRADGRTSDVLRVACKVYEDYSVDPAVAAGSGTALENIFKADKGEMKVNGSFLSDKMSLMGEEIRRGIAAKGNAQLLCPVDASWRYFTVRAGIDDAEDRRPCVRLQVWFGNTLAYESPIINPSKGIIYDEDRRVFPIALRIPEGTRTIRLVAAPGGFFADQNAVIWAEPAAH